MHLQTKVFLNGGSMQGDCCELRLFARFLREYPLPLAAFRSEWCIFAEEEQLAGRVSWPNARRAKSFSLIGKEPSSFVRRTKSLGEHETSAITFTRQRWNSLSLAVELVQF